MTKQVCLLFLFLLMAFGSTSQVMNESVELRPPTQCEDACMREYTEKAQMNEDSYRIQLQNALENSIVNLLAAWATFFDTKGGYSTLAAPFTVYFGARAVYQAISTADLNYYGVSGSNLNDFNMCMSNCPLP